MFFRELVLRPNCLLTRRALQIRPGPASFLNFRNPWKGLSHYLFQHGYQITSSTQNPSHIICSSYDLQNIPPDSTITILSPKPIAIESENVFQILIEPQHSHEFYARVLDHCIYLAELDYLRG